MKIVYLSQPTSKTETTLSLQESTKFYQKSFSKSINSSRIREQVLEVNQSKTHFSSNWDAEAVLHIDELKTNITYLDEVIERFLALRQNRVESLE